MTGGAQHRDGELIEAGNGNHVCVVIQLHLQYCACIVISLHCCVTLRIKILSNIKYLQISLLKTLKPPCTEYLKEPGERIWDSDKSEGYTTHLPSDLTQDTSLSTVTLLLVF